MESEPVTSPLPVTANTALIIMSGASSHFDQYQASE